MKNVLKDYIFYVKKSRQLDKWYFVLFFCDVIFQIMSPFALVVFPKYILNEIVTTRRINYITILLICMVVVDVLVNSLVQIFSPLLNSRIHYLRNKMSIDFSEKVLDLDYDKMENPEVMDMKQKAIEFVYGSEGIENVTFSAEKILVSIGQMVGYAYILLFCNPAIIVLIIICAFITARWHGKAEKYSYTANNEVIRENRQGSYLDFVCSDYEHYKDIRFFELKNWILDKKNYYNDIKLRVFKKTSKKFVKLGLVTTLMNNFLSVIYYSYLIFLLFMNRIFIGDFTMYLSSITNFATTANTISISMAKIIQADLRLRNYIDFMNIKNNMTKDKDAQGNKFEKDKFKIVFEDVFFKYPHANDWTLENINVEIKSGEKISVVGENGAGKTTFIKLLMRLYDPTSGRITINGTDIRDIDYSEYMRMFSAVFQDYHLFPFSIKENITFEKCNETDDKEVEKILVEVGLKDKVDNCKNGIHTGLSKQFDDEGTDLSGGESQKIAIGRAIYRNSPIIVLDEPTAALDPMAEYDIYKKYDSMVKGKTSIFISHRMASTKLSDKILVFQHGKLIEEGTHSELINNNGLYCNMYEVQRKYYI